MIKQAPRRAEKLYRGFMRLRPEDRQFKHLVEYAYYTSLDSRRQEEFVLDNPDHRRYDGWLATLEELRDDDNA